MAEQPDKQAELATPRPSRLPGLRLAAFRSRVSRSTVIAFLSERDQAAINVLALVIFIAILLIRVVFSTAKPWFPRAGALANLTADLGVAYLAAWFFYYLVSWRPGYRSRTLIARAVGHQAFEVMTQASQMITMLRQVASSSAQGALTRQELHQIAPKIHLIDLSGETDFALARQSTVLESLARYVMAIRAELEPIIQMAPLFDADLVAAAAALRLAEFARVIDGRVRLSKMPYGHMTQALDLYEDRLWDYLAASERGWLELCKRYPAAAATVRPDVSKTYRITLP